MHHPDDEDEYTFEGEYYFNGEEDSSHTLEPDYEAMAYRDEGSDDGCGQYGPDANINFEPPF